MYNDSYDNYIRSILGYPDLMPQARNDMFFNDNQMNYGRNEEQELEDCYPEIYRVIYPMICRTCMENTRPITRETIDMMADEIYDAVAKSNEVNININLQNEISNMENRNVAETKENATARETRCSNEKTESRQMNEIREDRRFRNRNLQDLIRILLIRELLRRRREHEHRPPFPGGPGRPPMFPGPGMPGRPPFPGGPGRPRNAWNEQTTYEATRIL